LLKLSTGADVNLDKAQLKARDLELQALVKVRLDEVRAILFKAFTTVSENPEILDVEKIDLDSAVEGSGAT